MENLNITAQDEKTPKTRNRREWIKNIIIIFLIVMLLLTFFSNTIMNYSLPEVSVARLSRDSVSKSNPVSIFVEANKSYSVTSDEIREIKRVAVKKGQEVKEGQVLFYLKEAKESEAAKLMTKEIDTLKLNYEKSLMKSDPDYFLLNSAVQKARDDLDKAKKLRDNPPKAPEYVDNSAQISALTGRKNSLEADMACLMENNYSALSKESSEKISEKYQAYTKAKAEYDAVQAEMDKLPVADSSALTQMNRTLEDLETELKRLEADKADVREIEDKKTQIKRQKEDIAAIENAVTALAAKQKELETKAGPMNTAKSEFDAVALELNNSLKSEIESVTAELMQYQNSGSSEMGMMPSDGNAEQDYDAAVRAAQYALDAAVHDLEMKISEDKITDNQEKLELEAAKKAIEEKEKELEELMSQQTTSEITSPVDGVVESITAVAGKTIEPNSELLLLNLSGDGFTAEYTVESEKVRKLTKGTVVKLVDNKDDITVTVSSLAKDKNDNKMMKIGFSVEGKGVVSGQTLKIDIGDAAVTLDQVIPKTAVKSDSSGKFVYAVKSKSSPLGNRYIVEKIQVTVTAEDDTKAAVTGDFGDSADYIITASSKPFRSGDQVRLAEE